MCEPQRARAVEGGKERVPPATRVRLGEREATEVESQGRERTKALLGAARSLESGPWLSPPPLFLSPLSPASTSPYAPCRSWPGLPGPEPPPRAPGTPNTPDTLIRQLSPFA